MEEVVKRKPPLPLAQSFLTCREIFRRPNGGTTLLMGPTARVAVTHFPAQVRLSVYAEFTGGHGNYQPQLSLRDEAEEVVWSWAATVPFPHPDPLRTSEVTFHDLELEVPGPGRYSLVLLLNGEEVAQRTMRFGPAEADEPLEPL